MKSWRATMVVCILVTTAWLRPKPVFSQQEAPAQFEARRELRIDGYEANLVPIRWLGVAPNGMIALVQRLDYGVRFFDPGGKLLGTFGRDGSGPGEFSALVTRGGWIGDTLWIADVGLRRITFISPERTLIRTILFRGAKPRPTDTDRFPSYPTTSVFPYAVLNDGKLLVLAGRTGHKAVLRTSADGIIQAVILRVDASATGSTGTVRHPINGGRGHVAVDVPFFPPSLLDVSPDGRHVAAVTTRADKRDPVYLVTVATSRGDTIFSRQYRYSPVPVSPSSVDSAMAVIAANDMLKRTGVLRELMDQVRGEIPPNLPPVTDMFIGADGRIWLGQPPTRAGRPWLILGKTGEIMGTVTVPHSVFLRAADQARLWGLERDEFDVESVVRYRLTPRS